MTSGARRKEPSAEICPTCGRVWRIGTPGKTPLAQALFQKRLHERLSIRDAVAKADVDVATFYRAEKGRMPSVENAVKFARWLGVSMDALFITDNATRRQ